MTEPNADYALCGLVTDYDDSIGGEGEILCGRPLKVSNDKAECPAGHRWVPCACGGPTCEGWKVAPRHIDSSGAEKIAFCRECKGRCDSCILTAEGHRPACIDGSQAVSPSE